MGQWLSVPMILGGLYLVADREASARSGSGPVPADDPAPPPEARLQAPDRRARADQRRRLYGRGERALLRDPRSARRGRRLHHRARDQPDVRRADRPLARRSVACAPGGPTARTMSSWARAAARSPRTRCGRCAAPASRRRSIWSRPARCCARAQAERLPRRAGTTIFRPCPSDGPAAGRRQRILRRAAGPPVRRRRRAS